MKHLLLLLLLPMSLWGGVYSNNDFQFWTTFSTSIDHKENFWLALETQERFGDGGSRLFYYHFQGLLFFELNKHVEIGPGYRHVQQLGLDQKTWNPIYNPMVDMNLKWDGSDGWKIVNRSRVQYIIVSSQGHLWQYRNRTALHPPWRIGKSRLIPRIEEEVYFRETFGFFENRFALGFDIPFSKKNSGTLLYMLRHLTVSSQWKHQHTFWMRFAVSF